MTISDNQIVCFQANASAGWLDGRTLDGSVALAPSHEGIYTGTRWLAHNLGDGTFGFECLGNIKNQNYVWLDGGTLNQAVYLSPRTDGEYTGTHWKIHEAEGGTINLKCMGNLNPTANGWWLTVGPDGSVCLNSEVPAPAACWGVEDYSVTCLYVPFQPPSPQYDLLGASAFNHLLFCTVRFDGISMSPTLDQISEPTISAVKQLATTKSLSLMVLEFYDKIVENIEDFCRAFFPYADALNCTGINIDYEGTNVAEADLAKLIVAIKKERPNFSVSIAPYFQMQYWQNVITGAGVDNVAFANLQLYSGGNPSPQDAYTYWKSWGTLPRPNNLTSGQFVFPGFAVTDSNNPYSTEQLATAVQNIAAGNGCLTGAFLWNNFNTYTDPNSWSRAIRNNLKY